MQLAIGVVLMEGFPVKHGHDPLGVPIDHMVTDIA
jgi:hypothetical protein